jgi:nickel-dependent lactate racemase
MAEAILKYGSEQLHLNYDIDRFLFLDSDANEPPLSDAEIGDRLDVPIGTEPLENIVSPGDSVLIVIPDATRNSASGQIVNLVVRRLIASGIQPSDIRAIVATGIHRKATEEEKGYLLTPFIYQRIMTLDHDPRDLMGLLKVGETPTAIPVELNRALFEHDHIVLVGGVSFHYFAGFTGGRKLICPGLASSRTISETHRLAFDCVALSRCEGVGTGILIGNVVHEAFVEAAAFAKPSFLVNTIVNSSGECVDLFCGDWRTSHEVACDFYANNHTVTIAGKRDLVIASCGGSPYDINLIQAHKALDAASKACSEGGTIILIAECRDGLGREDMAKWFESADSRELAAKLCEKYQVNGQTAWSIREKAERFDIRMVSSFDQDAVRSFGFNGISVAGLQHLLDQHHDGGYIIPRAGAINTISSVLDRSQ